MVKPLSRSNQLTEDTRSPVSTSTISTSNNVNTPLPTSRSRPSCLQQPDQPCVVSSTATNPNHHLKYSQEATTCAGHGGSNTNTTERRFGKNNYTTHYSPTRRATASLLQPNQKQAAVLSDAAHGHGESTLSRSIEITAHDGAVFSKELSALDNSNLKKHIQPIIPHLVKKKSFKSADPSLRSSKMPVSELPIGAALGNKKSRRPLDKKRKEDWIALIKLVAAGDAVSDPVDATNTDSSTSATGNFGNAGDSKEAFELSQNQSKC